MLQFVIRSGASRSRESSEFTSADHFLGVSSAHFFLNVLSWHKRLPVCLQPNSLYSLAFLRSTFQPSIANMYAPIPPVPAPRVPYAPSAEVQERRQLQQSNRLEELTRYMEAAALLRYCPLISRRTHLKYRGRGKDLRTLAYKTERSMS